MSLSQRRLGLMGLCMQSFTFTELVFHLWRTAEKFTTQLSSPPISPPHTHTGRETHRRWNATQRPSCVLIFQLAMGPLGHIQTQSHKANYFSVSGRDPVSHILYPIGDLTCQSLWCQRTSPSTRRGFPVTYGATWGCKCPQEALEVRHRWSGKVLLTPALSLLLVMKSSELEGRQKTENQGDSDIIW